MTRTSGLVITTTLLLALGASTTGVAAPIEPVGYRVQLDVVSEGYDGKFCWFHPRAGAIPGSSPTVVLTMQRWRFAASDVFYPVSSSGRAQSKRSWMHEASSSLKS